MTRRKRRKSSRRSITSIHVNAAGIDIGATFHVVAVPPERVEMSVRARAEFWHRTGSVLRFPSCSS